MPQKIPEMTIKPLERALLVGVEVYGQQHILVLEDSLAELALLAQTAGLDVVGQTYQRLDKPNVKTFIGVGKLDEVKSLSEELRVDVVLFDEELSGRHLREIEKILGDEIRVLDRTALILDIFAQHAHTREGALQVELAQYEYRLPRLTRAWTHLARQAGGGGGRTGSTGGVGLRGPGETQLEVDRREIHHHLEYLKNQLEKVRTHRKQYRARRRKSKIPVVALVGYTNAGKSTLLNKLSNADVYVANQLFATLDPTTRRVQLPGGHVALFTDTVGFIQKLPTTLIAAFQATLEEITEADLLIHLIDITHLNAQSQAKAVLQTLVDIEANHIPVLTVLNKIDKLNDPERARKTVFDLPNTVAISALTGEGVDDLLQKSTELLFETFSSITVRLPYQEGSLNALFHEQGQIDHIEHTQNGILIQGRLPGRLLAKFQPYLMK